MFTNIGVDHVRVLIIAGLLFATCIGTTFSVMGTQPDAVFEQAIPALAGGPKVPPGDGNG